MATTRRRWLLLPRSAFLVSGITVLLTLSIPSDALNSKPPSLEETIDFIILKLSGASAAARVECDQVQECGAFVDTAWQNWIAKSPSFCTVEVIQTVDVRKSQSTICVWTGDVIGGKRWSHVNYRREYRYRLDFGSIALNGITVEQATPENARCFIAKSDLPYAVHLTFTKGINARFQLKATGSGNGDKTSSEQAGIDTWNSGILPVGSEDTAERLARAFEYAATLCGARKALF